MPTKLGGLLERLGPPRKSRHRDADPIALVTANFGGIDTLKPLPPCAAVHGFYYTDAQTLWGASDDAVATWRETLVPNYPRHDFNPRLRGRYFKHQIHRLPEMSDYRWLAWADANVTFHDLDFLREAAARLQAERPDRRVALIRHPERETVEQEYAFISGLIADGNAYLRIRYEQEKMAEQMAFFAQAGWPTDAPLWCGTVWLIENSDLVRRCWDDWWDQNLRFGMMDQLSLPMMLRKHAIEPRSFDLSLVDNPHFTWGTHENLC